MIEFVNKIKNKGIEKPLCLAAELKLPFEISMNE